MNLILVILTVLGASLSGPLMAAAAAPPVAIAFWRTAAASVVTGPFAWTRNQPVVSRMGWKEWRDCAVAGALLAAHFTSWITALTLTSVADAAALVSTQLVWIVAIDWCRGMKATRATMLGSALTIVGVLVISGVSFSISSSAIAGDVLAVVAGICAALYLDAGRNARRRLRTSAYTFACYGSCSLVLLAMLLVTRQPAWGYSAKTWCLLAAVTLFCQLLGHSLTNHLLAVMSPVLLSLALLFQVPLATLIAGVFLGQRPEPGVYAGLAIMLGGLVTVVLNIRRPPT